jgi:hypothetical protein
MDPYIVSDYALFRYQHFIEVPEATYVAEHTAFTSAMASPGFLPCSHDTGTFAPEYAIETFSCRRRIKTTSSGCDAVVLPRRKRARHPKGTLLRLL